MALQFDPDAWPARWILSLIASGKLEEFYLSKDWKRLRLKILRERPCRCQLCEAKSPSVLTTLRKPWEKSDTNDRRPVAIVHHINELRHRPDLALSEYDNEGRLNLAIDCPSCHWDAHHKRVKPVTEERW